MNIWIEQVEYDQIQTCGQILLPSVWWPSVHSWLFSAIFSPSPMPVKTESVYNYS